MGANDWSQSFDEWRSIYRRYYDRAQRVSASIVQRARQEAERASLDPSICFLHAHNAMVSCEYGQPWPNVDYRRVRRVLWLERRSWEPYRLAERIAARAWNRLMRVHLPILED